MQLGRPSARLGDLLFTDGLDFFDAWFSEFQFFGEAVFAVHGSRSERGSFQPSVTGALSPSAHIPALRSTSSPKTPRDTQDGPVRPRQPSGSPATKSKRHRPSASFESPAF